MTNKKNRSVAAFILAGGANSRMGRAKGLIQFGGEPLILKTAQLVEPLVSSVTVIGPATLFRRLGLQTIPDRIRGVAEVPAFQGPLAGILTALGASKSRWNLVLACDLPYLTQEWIDALLMRAQRSDAQAYLPRTSGGLEPLAAVYHLDAYDKLAEAFREGVRKVTDALKRVSVETVALKELGEFGDSELVLKNMNTPDDLVAAKKWWEAKSDKSGKAIKSLQANQNKGRALRPNK